ncbi:MAG: proton-conducting transporter membrane subunit [Desulfuromonadales bacterium]|nr:proton-conducting transporter membrane subunit [Desulfuromonadales bacterium]
MLAALPLLIPLGTALLCALLHQAPHWQRRVSLGGALLLLVAAWQLFAAVTAGGAVVLQAGNWPVPYGIELVADRLGCALVLVAAVMLCIVLLWQQSAADRAPEGASFYPLLHGLVAGAGAAFVTADLFNLYVWFELALICAVGLLACGGALRQLDAAFKYLALNLVGTLLLLAAIALLYGATGHLNFRALGQALPAVEPGLLLPLAGLLVIAFLIKAAAFPFFAWLPASYHTLPGPVLALFSALLTKIGICALIRTFGGLLQPVPPQLLTLLGALALLSMVSGVLGAAYHWDMRRILAFHSISQVGYMLLAIAIGSRLGDATAIFFALHHSLVKAGLFLCAALIFHQAGHYDLRRTGGLYATRPGLALLFLLFALSLVGIPPLSGFWGKYLIVRESLLQGQFFWAGVALAVGALTFYSMLKIWIEAFWKKHPDPDWRPVATSRLTPAYTGLTLLLLVTLWMGLFPDTLIGYTLLAADSLRGVSP